MHSVRLEPTILILIGTRTTYQATGALDIYVLFYIYTHNRRYTWQPLWQQNPPARRGRRENHSLLGDVLLGIRVRFRFKYNAALKKTDKRVFVSTKNIVILLLFLFCPVGIRMITV